jgi:hypothetical protein
VKPGPPKYKAGELTIWPLLSVRVKRTRGKNRGSRNISDVRNRAMERKRVRNYTRKAEKWRKGK